MLFQWISPVNLSFFQPSKLSQKLLRLIFTIYLVVTIITTSAQFVSEYVRTQADVTKEIRQIGDVVNPSISRSLWQYDENQVKTLSDGVLRLPSVEAVVILDANQEKILSLTLLEDSSLPRSTFYQSSKLEWRANDKEILLGELRIYSSSRIVFQRIAFNMLYAIVAIVFNILALLFLFSWAFNRFMASPITDLTEQVGNIDWTHDKIRRIQIQQDDANELLQLEQGINKLLAKIEDDELKKERDAMVREQWLEAAVQERTKELLEANQKLETLAARDPLTNALNRRSFDAAIKVIYSKSVGGDGTSSYMMIDLDHFKKINDRYGHFVGDKVLVDVYQKIRKTLRISDLVGRVGGEEFAVFLPDTEISNAVMLANSLRELVEQSVLEVDGKEVHITISIGVASSDNLNLNLDELAKQADKRLYSAKEKGRNHVEY
jgi:diguanylate cyclase (GGDEF)-like protein